MKNNRLKQFWFMGVSTLLMVVFLSVMMLIVNDLQGNARVINYAGIVRGATQRLVKNELQGIPDNGEIARLDDILIGLQTGEGSHDIEVLKDEAFQEKLKALADKWTVLKSNIVEARNDESKRTVLYETSEAYFFMADDAVSSAEKYSSALTQKLKIVQILIVVNILIIIISLLIQILSEIKLNRSLNRIAYVDPHTGLPNKRSCEEKISDGGLYEKTHPFLSQEALGFSRREECDIL